MELHGVGVGRGIAAGSIVRMPEPLAEPADVTPTQSPDDAKAAVTEAAAAAKTK